ncbi:MAG: hypothetical protein WDN25_13660 [Acetobacteraceae bacterium]
MPYGRYDAFFLQKLRRTIRMDREKYRDWGLPRYHRLLTDIVREHAANAVNVGALSEENLRNYLNGTNSQSPVIEVLDVFVQLTYPVLRKTFIVDQYIETVGEVLSEYLESVTDFDRAAVIQRILGVYAFVSEDTPREEFAPLPERYFVLRRALSSNFLLVYEFDHQRIGSGQSAAHSPLRLTTGICIPHQHSPLLVMRDYKFHRLRLGKLLLHTGDSSRWESYLASRVGDATLAFTASDDINLPDHVESMLSYSFFFSKFNDTDWITGNLRIVRDNAVINRIHNVIDKFGGVF